MTKCKLCGKVPEISGSTKCNNCWELEKAFGWLVLMDPSKALEWLRSQESELKKNLKK